ncbi:MAG: valine--tRNA ligase [Nanoarchaeota archaeon]|nr:valine--tRNA ligase [Nanoarchaeota archaeon]
MKKYDPTKDEKKIRKFWAMKKIYSFDKKSNRKIYSIDTPPPTVSGKMHIGHAFSYSQQDFIARFKRMRGFNVFYPFGTDDNGLPTERLVENLKKVKSKDMSRTNFIKLCLETIKKITPDFIEDWKNIGSSCDFDLSYSTIDENSRRISQSSFLEMCKKGEAYKAEFPTIWCPECQTSIAQAELEDKELPSLFSTLKFECYGEELLIATTRPELLGACVAVFVHPDDKKYKSLVGKKAKVPLFDFEVPIIADKSADPEKGTGILMICSYGDKYDVEAVAKHKLEPRIILDKSGKLTNEGYKGLEIKEARKKILEELEKKKLIKEQKQITHTVNVHDKCGTEIEFIPTEQWFIKILDKKKELLAQGKKVKWHPEHMRKRYENWIKGLSWDWNISRERHFGIPIPVWYCKECNEIILPLEKELPVDPIETKKNCPKCKQTTIPEEKVLDTWATSSLTPQIASSLVNNKIKIPYSLRPQAHDIIRTWAFYTIVKSHYHERSVPWKNIAISGFVTLKGEKMSKSKGNVVDPRKIIDEFGADALRLWASNSKLGEDLDYQEKDLITGKKFINKLINSSKFVFMNLNGKPKKPKKLEHLDSLFLDRLACSANESGKYFEKYEYSQAKAIIEEFFWKDFCDNYLEIVKKRIYQGKGNSKLSAQYALYTGLLGIIKMFAPIVPFVTEHVYQEYFRKHEGEKSIHISSWPEIRFSAIDDTKWDNDWSTFIEILSKVRQEKTAAKKSMNSEIILSIPSKMRIFLTEESGILEDLKNVTNAREIKEGKFRVEFIE